MGTGYNLGLVLMYSVVAAYAVILLRILVQILFGAAIENRRRRQWIQEHGGAAHTFRAMAGRRGWANVWLPSTEPKLPGSTSRATQGSAALPFLVTQAIALIFVFIALGMASAVAAQERPGRDLSSADLRKELIDIRARQTELRIRLEQIDQELKPEAIERELAGIGSVHPEELRENRRKLLTTERNGLQAELDLLEEYRGRIEAAIVIDEEAVAFMKYDRPSSVKPSPQPQMAIALRNVRRPGLVLKFFAALSILIMLMGGLALLLLVGFQIFMQNGGKMPRATGNAQLRDNITVQTKAAAALPLERAQVE